MYYTGIGARSTPPYVLNVMTQLASKLESLGYILRSGGASGADSAFENGVRSISNREIYLPSNNFNSKSGQGYINSPQLPNWQQALQTVNLYHPAPDKLTSFAKSLMARNAMQVLGGTMNTPSKMVVAWTPGGEVTGGTGQALRIAQAHKIPIRNLGNLETLQNVQKFIQS